MVAIGKVLRNDSNNFVYLPKESELTVWRGMSFITMVRWLVLCSISI